MDFKECQVGDIVKFIDPDPEFAPDYGMVGTIWYLIPAENKPGCERPLVQVDYHGSYGVHLPEQLEKLL